PWPKSCAWRSASCCSRCHRNPIPTQSIFTCSMRTRLNDCCSRLAHNGCASTTCPDIYSPLQALKRKMDTLFKYPRTQHLEGSGLQANDDPVTLPFRMLAGQTLTVEEKVDGANCGISFEA